MTFVKEPVFYLKSRGLIDPPSYINLTNAEDVTNVNIAKKKLLISLFE
jgi:hypothetical protein